MLKSISSLCLSIILAGSIVAQVNAQETKDLQAAFGSVIKTSENQIVISQYNSDQEIDQEVTYVVDPQTHIEGATTVGEIAAGQEVEILYEDLDGNKVARFISKELLPDDETPDTTGEDVLSNVTSEDL